MDEHYSHAEAIQAMLKREKQMSDKCNCGNEQDDEHTCPFAEDVGNDSESLCRCCEECTYQCAMDV
jgi:hypothetical protein